MPMHTMKTAWLTGKETFIPQKTGKQNLSLTIPNDGQAQSTSISATEAKAIDNKCETTHCEENEKHSTIFPQHTTKVFSLTMINDPMWMTKMMEQRAQLGHDQMLIGATTMVETSNLITDDESSSDDDEDELLVGDIDGDSPTINDDVDLDAIFIAGVDASRPGSTDVQHLAKVWHISYEDAKRMLDVTSQHSVRKQDPMPSKNYGMNNRMIRYKCIREYFFMDMIFTTSKGGKSSHGHTFCQLLMTDKEFPYMVPMKQNLKFSRQ